MLSVDTVFISTIFVIAMMASLGISTFAIANSMMFEHRAYAVDNCDATSTCTNFQSQPGNSQTNNCINSSNCRNAANGNDNTQINRCDSVREFGCSNFLIGEGNSQINNCNSIGHFGCSTFAEGNDNTLSNHCEFAECNSIAHGSDNTINTECFAVETFCQNGAIGDDDTSYLFCARMRNCDLVNGLPQSPVSSSSRSTTCANSDICSNLDVNSNVMANGASCKSNGPDTTTFCQPNRVIIRPNP